MNYTSDEILAATTRLVQDAMRRPYGDLGNRDKSITLSDIQDAAAGVFILFPSAPFYIVDLGTRRTQDLVGNYMETLGELTDAITAMGRNTTPVRSISSLNNAKVALESLGSAATVRANSEGGTFTAIEEVPAWRRFDANIQRFLNEYAGNIKSGGNIVDTPKGAQSAIPALVTSVKEQHADLIRRMELLRDAISDFESLKLRATLQAGILERANEVLETNINLLEGLTPEQRLGEMRAVTLDLLAARAIVRGFGSLTSPTLFALVDGTGSFYADADHPATPAAVTSENYAPFVILGGSSQLDIFLEGASSPTVTVAVQGSFVAKLDGLLPEPFDIGAPNTLGIINDEFQIDVTDELSVPVAMTTGATVPIETVVADINAAIAAVSPPPPIEAVAYLNPSYFTGSAVATTGPDRFTFVNPAVSPAALGFGIGDKVVVKSGDNDGNVYDISGVVEPVGATPGYIDLTIFIGTHVAATNDVIEIGANNRLLRIRILDDVGEQESALAINRRIDLPDINAVAEEALKTLGYIGPVGIASRRTTAAEVVKSLDSNPSTVLGLTTKVTASRDFTATLFSGQGRTDMNSSLKYVLFKLREVASSVVTVASVTTITVADTSSISTGDIMALREAAGANDVNAYGTITVTSSTEFTVTSWASDDPLFSGKPDDATNVLVEVGPDLTIPNDCLLRIDENGIVDGDYTVSFSGSTQPNSIPFELPLTRAFPIVSVGGQPIVSTVELGQEKVSFHSTDVTLDTKVEITDGDTGSGPNPVTAVLRFFPSGSASGVGTTTWFQIPENPKSLEVGDQLELYESNYNIVSQSFVIKSMQLSDLLLELETAADTDLPSFEFSTSGKTVPFARIRKAKRNNFDVFSEAADDWLGLDENEDGFMAELDAVINPLMSNSNPSIVQVNDAKLKVQEILIVVEDLEAVLDAYEADVVKQVDVLIDSFQEKGADRAVDLLLEGQFSTFFGLTVEGQSYAGEVMRQVKEVQRQDLPVKKVRRAGQQYDSTVAQWEDKDYEFDQSDIEGFEEVDIPTDFVKPFPGGSY